MEPIAGTQVFVDGHFFSFFSHYQAGNRYLRLSHHTQQSDHSWTTIPSSVLVPVRETAAPGDDVIATDWVRFTARVDPVTQTADVWLNGQLVITDAVRSPAYVAPFPGSFFLRAGLVEWEMGEMGSGEMGSGKGNGVSVHKTTLTTRILPVTGRAWPAASALNIPARITT